MLEILLLVVVAVAMYRVAENDNQPGFLWGALTVLFGVVSLMFIPLPLVRMGLAGLAAFLAFIGYKVAFNK